MNFKKIDVDTFEQETGISVENYGKMVSHISDIMKILGYDVDDSSIKDTPERHVRYLIDYRVQDTEELDNRITEFEIKYNQIVAKVGIPFSSLCEHHLIPFSGKAKIAYLPPESKEGSKVLGISKLTRIVQHFSQHFSIQESLTEKIGKYIEDKMNAEIVWVQLSARHLCEEIRGVKSASDTKTSYQSSALRDNDNIRREIEQLFKDD